MRGPWGEFYLENELRGAPRQSSRGHIGGSPRKIQNHAKKPESITVKMGETTVLETHRPDLNSRPGGVKLNLSMGLLHSEGV